MSELTAVLRRYVATGPPLGTAAFPGQELRKDLATVIRTNSSYFMAVFATLLVLLLLAVLLVARHLDEPAKAGAVLTATGVSIPFLLRTMLRMWETKTNSEALMHLASSLEGDTLRSVVKVLSESVQKKRW